MVPAGRRCRTPGGRRKRLSISLSSPAMASSSACSAAVSNAAVQPLPGTPSDSPYLFLLSILAMRGRLAVLSSSPGEGTQRTLGTPVFQDFHTVRAMCVSSWIKSDILYQKFYRTFKGRAVFHKNHRSWKNRRLRDPGAAVGSKGRVSLGGWGSEGPLAPGRNRGPDPLLGRGRVPLAGTAVRGAVRPPGSGVAPGQGALGHWCRDLPARAPLRGRGLGHVVLIVTSVPA